MSDELNALKLLAEQDRSMQELRRKLGAIPQQLADSRKQLDAEKKILDEVKVPHDTYGQSIGEKESTIAIALETIEKFEEHLKEVTTQAEYLMARKQIDEAKRLNLRLEDEIVELKAKREELAPEVQQRQGLYNNVLETYQRAEGEILKEQSAVEKQVAEYEKSKAEAAKQVSERSLAYYERLTKSGKVPALVSTEGGICGGCNIALPPQVYNQLIANAAKYNSCSHCNRMIYYEPPPADEEEETRSA